MNKDKRNNIKLLGTLNNSDESGIIANANQIYDANEDKSTQDVSKEHTERIKTLETKENSMQTTLENITKTGEASAASNVTYNHSDSELDATNVQQAIDEVYKRYYDIMFQLCESGLFNGLAHPDSIKCFGYIPNIDLTESYNKLAVLLNKHGMYAENSGGLRLNYSPDIELGLNPQLLSILRKNNVQIETASDAHKQSDVGANIPELENMLKD